MATPPSSIDAPCKLSDEADLKRSRIMRAQWLRAAILGANDGLLSTTSLMLGVGAAKEDRGLMIVSGLAGAVAGACSMAVGEFVSVSTQRDIERTAIEKTDNVTGDVRTVEILQESTSGADPSPARSPFVRVVFAVDSRENREEEDEEMMPNPYKAAFASALAFLCGSGFPILAALAFSEHRIRIVGMVVVTTLALLVFGAAGARLGGSPVRVSAIRVLIGGWISMGVTYGLLKPLDQDHD